MRSYQLTGLRGRVRGLDGLNLRGVYGLLLSARYRVHS
jgi:hypothetical protein